MRAVFLFLMLVLTSGCGDAPPEADRADRPVLNNPLLPGGPQPQPLTRAQRDRLRNRP